MNSICTRIEKIIEESPPACRDFLTSRALQWLEEGNSCTTATAEERLNKLREEVLFNPLIPTLMLKEPVLERDWVWERWMLEDFQKTFPDGMSPFDGEKMKEFGSVKTHELARVILREISSSETLPTSEALVMRGKGEELVAIGKNSDGLQMKAYYYEEMARIYVQTQNLETTSRFISANRLEMEVTARSAATTTGELTLASQTHRAKIGQIQARGVLSVAASQREVQGICANVESSMQAERDVKKIELQAKEAQVKASTDRLRNLGGSV